MSKLNFIRGWHLYPPDSSKTGWYVGDLTDYDKQAIEELDLSDRVRVPLPEAEARAIQKRINDRANQLRTYAERGYGPTAEEQTGGTRE